MKYLVVFILYLFNLSGHEYYLSVSTLKFIENGIEIEIRVFKDDLEKVVNDDFENLQKNPQKVYEYFEKHFLLYANDRPQKILFEGLKDKNDAAVVIGRLMVDIQSSFKVVNTIFIKDFSTQKNVLHIYRNDRIKTTVLDARTTTYIIF